jgi:hypothetical protein
MSDEHDWIILQLYLQRYLAPSMSLPFNASLGGRMMRSPRTVAVTFAVCACVVFSHALFAQELPRIAVGANVSTLGIGFEAATAVTNRSNVRGGMSFFNYDRVAASDGITYDAELTLRSAHITYDQYLHGGFHVSPGLLVYNGNRAHAIASVPASQSFSLGEVRYFSSATNPVNGSATLKLGRVAPLLLAGFGNLLPRNNRRFGVNADFGVAFQGSPDVKLNLAGMACAVSPTAGCVNAATDALVQSNVQLEQEKANEDLRPFKYYPVVSIGFSWKF